jgi:putative glutamine amidotransferase
MPDPRVNQFQGAPDILVAISKIFGYTPIVIPRGSYDTNYATSLKMGYNIDGVSSSTPNTSLSWAVNLGNDPEDRPIIAIAGRRVTPVSENPNQMSYTAATKAIVDFVYENGGQPFIMPPNLSEVEQNAILSQTHGIVFAGGGDIHPKYSKAINTSESPEAAAVMASQLERDEAELRLAKIAQNMGMSILAICRGLQIFNVVNGGTLEYIDDVNNNPSEPTHLSLTTVADNTTQVEIIPGTKLGDRLIAAEGSLFEMPSAHHMAILKLGNDLFEVGNSFGSKRIIKFASNALGNLIAAQGHPEFVPKQPFAKAMGLMFIENAAEYRDAKREKQLAY